VDPLKLEMEEHLDGFHTFTPKILQARLPSKWKWLNVKSYNGTTDPKAHLKSYLT